MKLFKNTLLIVTLLSTFTAQPMKRQREDGTDERAAKKSRGQAKPIRHVCIEQTDPENPTPTVILVSSDGEEFEVARSLAEQSVTIKNMLEDMGDDAAKYPIPMHNINAQTLGTAISCAQDMNNAEIIVTLLPTEELHALLLAANFLDIPKLLDLCLDQWAEICTAPEALETFKNTPDQHPAIAYWLPEELDYAIGRIVGQEFGLTPWVLEQFDLCMQVLDDQYSTINAIGFSQDNSTLAIDLENKAIKKWKLIDGQWPFSKTLDMSRDIKTSPAKNMCYSHSRLIMASAQPRATAPSPMIFKAYVNNRWVPIKPLNNRIQMSMINSIGFSHDDKIFVAASYHEGIKFWNVDDGSLITTLECRKDEFNLICFNHDDTILASSCRGKISIWNFELIRKINHFMHHTMTIKHAVLIKLILDAFTSNEVFDLSTQPVLLREIFESLPEELRTLFASKNIVTV